MFFPRSGQWLWRMPCPWHPHWVWDPKKKEQFVDMCFELFQVWSWYDWLVVWLPSILFSHEYWVSNHPNWLSYFSEGWPNHQPDDHHIHLPTMLISCWSEASFYLAILSSTLIPRISDSIISKHQKNPHENWLVPWGFIQRRLVEIVWFLKIMRIMLFKFMDGFYRDLLVY